MAPPTVYAPVRIEDRVEASESGTESHEENSTLLAHEDHRERDQRLHLRVQSLRSTVARWYTAIISLIALSATIGWGQTLYKVRHGYNTQTDKQISLGGCGSTPEDSLRRGCVFDLMMYNWVQPECYYKEVSQKFIDDGNWTFYEDQEGQNPIQDYDSIYRGEIKQVWLRGDFHHSHCAYILHKRLLAEDGATVSLDVKTRSRAHTEHCIKWVSQPKPHVFELATLNLTSESLDCVSGKLTLACQQGYDECK